MIYAGFYILGHMGYDYGIERLWFHMVIWY